MSPVRKSGPASRDESPNGFGYDDLIGVGQCAHPGRDVDRQTADVVAAKLHLSGMNADADGQTDPAEASLACVAFELDSGVEPDLARVRDDDTGRVATLQRRATGVKSASSAGQQ